jgi:general secretion pathway protein D
MNIKLFTASALVLLLSNQSMAQNPFRKFRSKTGFAKPKVEKAQLEQSDDMEEMEDIEKEMDEDDAKDNAPTRSRSRSKVGTTRNDDQIKDKAYFGNRKQALGFTGSKTNSTYVNLNPETAFGPEIVQSFDFPETEIMELTKHMQKLTGINLILDKEVKGKVSIVAPTPITVGDAWKAYLTALNMSGYTLVKTGAFYKVINARDIRYTPTKIYTGSYTPNTDNYIMKVIALKNISASELARNFRPFMTRYGRIIDIKQTNTIIVADTGTNINRLVKLVKFLDVPGHEESLQIIAVRNSSAQEIAKLLDSILKGGGSGSRKSSRRSSGTARATSKGGSENISKIIAEPRTNSIIAMANAEGAKQLRQLIHKLDVKLISSGSSRVHVHYLNHGNAEEISKTLSSIVSSGSSAKSSKSSNRFTSGSASESIFSAEVKVTADKANNALVVTASPTDWLTLQDVIGKLDIPRDQVYVEGLIMETSITRNKSFGVNYVGATGPGSAQRFGFVGSPDLMNLMSGQYQNLSGFFVGGAADHNAATVNVGGVDMKFGSINGLIKMVASHSNTNVLATPQILASDNTEAIFEVGETVPVLSTTTNNGVSSQTVTTQKVAMVLKITPQINKVTRFIKLKIDQRIDDFNTGKKVGDSVGDAGGIATTSRSIVTDVIVRDKDTIAMGGLMRDKETTVFSKIPLLGDIPVLGWLFKNKARSVEKVNMLFFLTPTILAPYEKTASSNTAKLMGQRRDDLKEILNGDGADPYKKKVDKLQAKIDSQMQGALYEKISNQKDFKVNEDTYSSEPEDVDYQQIMEDADTNE